MKSAAHNILLTTALLVRATAADIDHDPAAELASFQVAEGFEVNLFASETNGVIKPIQMRFDAQGRLWVIGSTVYPQIEPGQIPNDKVLILEDTNADGQCDRTTVFADRLMIPTGIELGDGGAYVGHGTELLFLKDRDSDGRADERRVVLRGFGTGDNHQNINSFTWGPGGELWMCQGLHIHSNVETPWGIVRLHEAGIWRFRPRLRRLEGFYGWEHEPQNPWGFVFMDWGEPIVLAGNNSSHSYPVPALVPNRRNEAPPLIWPTGQGRKCSGGDIVGTAHFPDDWQGLLVMGGYINNAVWVVKIVDDGAGFRLEDRPPLIRSTHRAFRPVDVKFGPDGALYICDWYNPIIGHYQASFRDPNRDKTHGRIWRVTAKGRPLAKPAALAQATTTALLEHLKSPDRWTRHFAKRTLADLPREEAKTATDKWVAQSGLTEHALKEALGVYQSHEIVAPELLDRLCRARDPGARAYAASVIGLWADRLENPLALLQGLVTDEHPRVRLQAVIACAHVASAAAIEIALTAGDLPSDRFLDYAFRQVVFSRKPHWLAAFQRGELKFDNKLSRLGLLVRADNSPDTVAAVREIARRSDLSASVRQNYWILLAEHGDAGDYAAILALDDPGLQAAALPALSAAARVRSTRPHGDVVPVLNRLLVSDSTVIRREAAKLIGAWKIAALQPALEQRSHDENADRELRLAAIESLALFRDHSSQSNLVQLAQSRDAKVASASIIGLAASDLTRAATLAAEFLQQRAQGADEVFSAFFAKHGGAVALAAALASKPPNKAAAEIGLRVMNSAGKRHEDLARLLSQAAGLERRTAYLRGEDLKAFVSEVRQQGDANRGAEIYRKPELGCVACHAVQGSGGAIGPDLSAVGSAQPIEFIIGAILEPQKEIKEGFTSVSIVTRAGDEHQGYVVREARDELVLRDALQNKELRLARDAIKERRPNGSVMPEGLVDILTRAELRDLVRYLSELGATKLSPHDTK